MGVSEKYNYQFGYMEKGAKNLVTDVPGVRVGHTTIHNGEIHTGVTALIPHGGDIFLDKCVAAAHVINGFGKSVGLMQVQELGTIETPILLTNTLSVGTAFTALVEYMLSKNDDIGIVGGTVNPIVAECNDGYLNDIRGLHVTKQHALAAIEAADELFEEGDVGAGAGMSCYSLKGGIGSASRIFELYGKKYTLGTLLLCNFGTLRDLTISGDNVGKQIYENGKKAEEKDKGSVIIIIATDAPLSSRQLSRAAKRAQSGLAKTGSITGSGSGDIAIAFTTANRVPHKETGELESISMLHENDMDTVFRAVIECVEESVISSMLHAKTVVGRAGNRRQSLAECIENL